MYYTLLIIQISKQTIFRIRENIEKASMSDLKDFLENIRRFSPKIGEVAMKHVNCFHVFIDSYRKTNVNFRLMNNWLVIQQLLVEKRSDRLLNRLGIMN